MKAMLLQADARAIPLADESVDCCVTSPPYFGLRDYGVAGQIGLERTPDEYVAEMVKVFREVRRVLKPAGTLWLNIGDSYANDGKWGGSSGGKHADGLHGDTGIGRGKRSTGLKPKDLIGIPWLLAFALRADGWYLRQDIIWHKPNPMPESVRDRCTKSHEYIFLLTKSERYYYDAAAVKEPAVHAGKMVGNPAGWATGSTPHNAISHQQSTAHRKINGGKPVAVACASHRNPRSVWSITTKPFKGAHFATFPPEIPERCIKAGCPAGGVVLDPFAGSGTTVIVARLLGRIGIGLDRNAEYLALAVGRVASDAPSPVKRRIKLDTQPTLFGVA